MPKRSEGGTFCTDRCVSKVFVQLKKKLRRIRDCLEEKQKNE